MFARTERLLLRPGWPEDAPEVFNAINDRDIVRMLANAPWPYTLSDAKHWLDSEPEPLLPNFLLFERTIGAPVFIGSAGLGWDDNDKIQIGYWLRRSHWGKGFATEAGRAVLEVAAALGHKHISAGHFTDNPGSGSVLRKLGFRPTGRVEQRKTRGRGSSTAACVLYENDLGDQSGDPDATTDLMRPLAA